MGIVAAVGGFISGAISTACSVGRAVCGGISSFVSSIGNIAKGIAPIINDGLRDIAIEMGKIGIPDIIGTIVETICEIVEIIGRKLGLIEEKDTAEELGFKAQEAEKKPDDFDNVEEYINYLRNEIEMDREKFDNLNEEDKLSCGAIGSTILAKGISEKKGVELSAEFLVEVAKQKMKGEEVEAYIDNFKKNDLNTDSIKGYLTGALSNEEDAKIEPVLKETLKELNPDLSEDEIVDKMGIMAEISLSDFE